MIKLTIWDIVGFFAYQALPYASPLLIAGIAILLLAPRLRARHGARLAIAMLLSAQLALVILAVPMLQEGWKERRRAATFAAATHHLDRAQTLGGVGFPAGSTVHLTDDGRVAFGEVPKVTLILGVPLIGSFSLEGDELVGSPGIAKGTLAQGAVLHGIACGPGPLFVRDDEVRCILARDTELDGYSLAAGHVIEAATRTAGHVQLRFGTLTRPTRVYRVLWPAGTVIDNPGAPPEQMADAAGQGDASADFCLPAGVEASIGVGVLHGPMSYTVQGSRRLVMGGCYPILNDVDARGGYAAVEGRRYGAGERATAAAAWTWTEPVATPAP